MRRRIFLKLLSTTALAPFLPTYLRAEEPIDLDVLPEPVAYYDFVNRKYYRDGVEVPEEDVLDLEAAMFVEGEGVRFGAGGFIGGNMDVTVQKFSYYDKQSTSEQMMVLST